VSRKLFVIDDEMDICDFVRDVAEDLHFDVTATSKPVEFPGMYSALFDCIVMDLSMPEMDGIEMIRFLGDNKSVAALVLISGFDKGILGTAERLARDRGLNVLGALSKPIMIDDLETLLDQVVANEDNDNAANIEAPSYPSQGSDQFPSAEELRMAIRDGEIIPYFQPRVNACDGTIAGVETLARWAHPIKGMIPPSMFIVLAEENDLIDDLTDAIVEKALDICVEWKDAGLIIEISVNFSARTLADLDLPDLLAAKVRSYGLDPSQIVVEVTESSVVSDLDDSTDVLVRLRMKGFGISIDDFGTGFSSMQQLQNLPFTEIKVDQSFVSRAVEDPEALAIVETTIDLGKKLGLTVVGEGVEDQQTWDLMDKSGCDQIQGYFSARPMPGDKLLQWVEDSKG